jgi:cobalamin biosynthesis protein CobW
MRRVPATVMIGFLGAGKTSLEGFVDLPGRDRRQVVQVVGDRFQSHFDGPWGADEKRQTRLVMIGLRGLDRAAIKAPLGN